MKHRAALSMAAGLLCLLGTMLLHAGAPAAADWDQASAARYLDRRMDLWWTQAKRLRTGDGEIKCLSCHTAIPYAWARAALRHAQGVGQPTSHEERIIELASRRVQYASGDQPYYDNSEAKIRESHGVEAVLNAVVLTSRDLDRRATEPGVGTSAALSRLWQVQRGDGAWDWLDFGLEPYEAPDAVFHGATLAALAAGTPTGRRASDTPEGRAGRDRLRAYVTSSLPAQRLFNRTWALLAASRLVDLLTDADRAAIMGELESHQRADGGWSLADLGPWRWNAQATPPAPPGTIDRELLAASDAYATGLVVYAMRQAGRSTAHPSVARGQRWLVEHQAPERASDPSWAPWRAYSLNHDREHGGPRGEPWRRLFMSDLGTAFAVLALL